MTRKDYRALAAALRQAFEATDLMAHATIDPRAAAQAALDRAVARVADVLAEDSPRFDRERFIAAVYAR